MNSKINGKYWKNNFKNCKTKSLVNGRSTNGGKLPT